jgi:ABC-type bacteriocin/lantibiotic exporter with double-glycine peptidase domain
LEPRTVLAGEYEFSRLVSSIVLLVVIMLALIAIDPMVASVAAVGFGASYVLITWMSRRRLHRNSQRIARALYKQASVLVFDEATSAARQR